MVTSKEVFMTELGEIFDTREEAAHAEAVDAVWKQIERQYGELAAFQEEVVSVNDVISLILQLYTLVPFQLEGCSDATA